MRYTYSGLKRLGEPLIALVVAQLVYLVVGIAWLSFDLSPWSVLAAAGTALATEAFFIYAFRKKLVLSPSALAAALGICIFLRAPSIWYFAGAAFVAMASKYVLRTEKGHIFNPSNIAIVLTVLLFSSATIEFTQWGQDLAIYIAVAVISFTIAYRAGKLPITFSFLLTYTALFFALLPFVPDRISAHHYGILGPSFILFASFMITDPKTTPSQLRPMIAHGVGIALFYFILEMFQVRYSLFLATFLITIFVFAIRYILPRIAPPQVTRFGAYVPLCIISVLFVGMYASTTRNRNPEVSPVNISIDFLLRGVVSDSIARCGSDPAFVSRGDSELEVPSQSSTQGAAWGDFNGDGYDDIFVSNRHTPSVLYRNNRDGTFTDVTAEVGLPNLSSASGFFIDYNNDSKVDLFVLEYGDRTPKGDRTQLMIRPALRDSISLYENNADGTFTNVSEKVGLQNFRASDIESDWSTMTAADIDSDGDLDLVLSNSGQHILTRKDSSAFRKSFADGIFPANIGITCEADTIRALVRNSGGGDAEAALEAGACAYMSYALEMFSSVLPWDRTSEIVDFQLYIPGTIYAFENRDGTFVERPELRETVSKTYNDLMNAGTVHSHTDEPYPYASGIYYQSAAFDYNKDGRVDILIAADWGRNLLLRNDGDFQFTETGLDSGLAYYSSGMGVALADYNRDGWDDVAVTNMRGDYLFENQGGTFTRDELYLSPLGIGWGISFLDFDMDGLEDVILTNGDVGRTTDLLISSFGRAVFRNDRLYRNTGSTFENHTWTDLCPDAQSGKSLAVSDITNDGTPDVFVGNLYLSKSGFRKSMIQANKLYENQSKDQHFLGVRLRGTFDNSLGVGARVIVESADATQTKTITAGGSLNSQNSARLLFGFGASSEPVTVTVEWPRGGTTRMENVAVDRDIVIVQK